MTSSFIPDDFPQLRRENVRYSDTDRQGHVNNAVFSTFLECARTDILYDKSRGLLNPDRELVIVKIAIEFLAELSWPGSVEIGSRVAKVGHSSIMFEQAIFQGDKCASVSTSVMVMIDKVTRKSAGLPEDVAERLADLIIQS
ncbi:MAG: thioesterase family protein [Porticoccaceae bacterium]|jgi:acyl-CoA thioester hydrolase|nr:acyl-CoA thioesterase [bacterium]MDG0971823.1 thioesterase family protein [Porticoccaceae bacterium]MDG1308438.1 thioesterase family protein [Porticoccaceae bacterium]